MSENTLVLKSINQLFEFSFLIPSYQRGYRWTKEQVEQLLEDIWAFALCPPKQDKDKIRPFYCLQPIVVKLREGNEWEVIDGQQRLTTIYLILKNLETQIERDQKNFQRLFYETRLESEKFLMEIKETDAENNIDFYHFAQANRTIQKWFKNKANKTEHLAPKSLFAPTFLTDTKVIWYEVNDGSDSYDIFTRLNIGKIQLTNSELIRALFLKKWGNTEAVDKIRLKQLQIASEWDRIENTLQDNSFWYFIYNKLDRNNPKYANRIEYIFDLMTSKPEGAEEKYTFYKFNEEFEKSKSKSKKEIKIPDIDELWLRIKKYFLTFEEWYKNRDLYHLIGFLISVGYNIQDILEPMKEKIKLEIKSKTDFKKFLKDEICQKVKFDIKGLIFDEKNQSDRGKIKTILLLFNIQTILSNNKSNMRFPFNLYKNDDWDIEHVRSLKDKKLDGNDRIEWAKDILEYFTGTTDLEKQTLFISKIEKQDQEVFNTIQKGEITKFILSELFHFATSNKVEENRFNIVYAQIRKEFREDNEPSKYAISNLALLDSATNRSYKNAFFPIKRKIILDNDKRGTFIPLCTKNVFMKAYSKRFDEVMYWNKFDADYYLSSIEETLFDYLPKTVVKIGNE